MPAGVSMTLRCVKIWVYSSLYFPLSSALCHSTPTNSSSCPIKACAPTHINYSADLVRHRVYIYHLNWSVFQNKNGIFFSEMMHMEKSLNLHVSFFTCWSNGRLFGMSCQKKLLYYSCPSLSYRDSHSLTHWHEHTRRFVACFLMKASVSAVTSQVSLVCVDRWGIQWSSEKHLSEALACAMLIVHQGWKANSARDDSAPPWTWMSSTTRHLLSAGATSRKTPGLRFSPQSSFIHTSVHIYVRTHE